MTSSAHIIRRRRARKARHSAAQTRSRLWWGFIGFLLLVGVVIPVGVTVGGAALVYLNATRNVPTPQDSLTRTPAAGVTELYDRSGQTLLLQDQSGQARAWATLNDLPAYALQATLLAEDPHFLNEARFNPLNTFSLLWQNMLFGPLTQDRTLTGRLVRNVIAPLPEVPTSDDIGREIALVADLERRYTPEDLLEWHLNTNDYGNQAYGIEAAAQIYLGKPAADLTLDEAALLAAIPMATQYNPFDNETAARGRQRDLLRALRADGSITGDQFEAAAATVTPILLATNQPQQIAPEFVAYARRQAQDILDAQGRDGARLVSRGGLRILTTLDLDLYDQSECALRTQVARLNGKATSPDTRMGNACLADGLPPVTPLAGNPPDQNALVILDAGTGEILSMVGAAAALNAQPGPVLRPFAYFIGFINAAYNPARMVLDIPSRFPGAAEGLIYAPANADGRYRGPLNLRDAMAAGLLPPAVQVAYSQGMDNLLRIAHRIGLNSLGEDGRYDLSLLERGGAVSVLDVAYAYGVFAAQGDMRGIPTEPVGQGFRQRNPVAVLRIEDGDGAVIWEYNAATVAQNQVSVFQHELGYLVNDILADSARRRDLLGESAALELNRRAAVVNGLTGSAADSWTVGYTPQRVIAVHLGRGDGAAMPLDSQGTDGAAAIWPLLTTYAHNGLPVADWTRPDGVVQMSVCERSGLLPNGVCPVRSEWFLAVPGFQPSQPDTYWQQVDLNSQTGQLATATTPGELRRTQVYFIPPTEAEDWWKANNLPLPPTQYDTISRPELFSSVQILQPQSYAYVGGVVDVRGTMDITNLQYFQLAYGQGQNPSEWIQIGEQQTAFNRGATIGQWDTTGLNGLYNLLLTVARQDNALERASVQVIVDNTAPTLTLSAGDGQPILWPAAQNLMLTADARDDYALAKVDFYHNGTFLATVTQAPYTLDWAITQTGTETFTAVAFDAVGNQATSEVTVTIARG